MKYKVGDKVRIKSIDWYHENKDEYDDVDCGSLPFTNKMIKFCGKTLTISQVDNDDDCYIVEEDNKFGWTDEMIEGLVEEPTVFNGKEFLLKLANIELPSGTTTIWECPDGYVFKDENDNIINTTKIVLEKKKKEYPKTYEECCKVLGIEYPFIKKNENTYSASCYKNSIIVDFIQLIICRDAYWKIAGEEMGLGKPWEPTPDTFQPIYVIRYIKINGKEEWDKDKLDNTRFRYILSFPTKEMRDAFYDNFKDLIELCKELL